MFLFVQVFPGVMSSRTDLQTPLLETMLCVAIELSIRWRFTSPCSRAKDEARMMAEFSPYLAPYLVSWGLSTRFRREGTLRDLVVRVRLPGHRREYYKNRLWL